MLSLSLGMPSRNKGRLPSIWDTYRISGRVLANPAASSSAPYPQDLNPWSSNASEHASPHVMRESQTQVQDQRCQSGPWPGRWGPQGRRSTGGGRLARVPNLRVCEHPLVRGWHTQGGKDEISILPWYRPVGVAKTSSDTETRENRAARKGKWSPRGTGNREAPPLLEVRPGNRQGW